PPARDPRGDPADRFAERDPRGSRSRERRDAEPVRRSAHVHGDHGLRLDQGVPEGRGHRGAGDQVGGPGTPARAAPGSAVGVVSGPGATVPGMAVAWTAIGLLATTLAVLAAAVLQLGARIDATNRDLGARIEQMARELVARMDAMNRDLGARMDAMNRDLG